MALSMRSVIFQPDMSSRLHTLVLLVLTSLCAFLPSLWSQEMPELVSFGAGDYGAAAQNWDFVEGCDGNLYVANSEGVLVYNGFMWSLIPLPTSDRARSVYLTSNCEVVVGGFETIGYIKSADDHQLIYQALAHGLEGSRQEIWNIVGHEEVLYYQSFSRLYRYDGQQIDPIDLPSNIMLGAMSGESLILPTIDSGVYEYERLSMSKIIPASALPSDSKVSAIAPAATDGSLYIALEQDGIYLYADDMTITGPIPGQWNDSQINRMIRLSDGGYAVGTISDGVYLTDADLQVVHHITRRQGLTDNTVLALYQDRHGDLWIGSDRGINVLRLSRSQRYYYDLEGLLGTIYSASEHDGVNYLGTNQGAFVNASGGDHTLIPGTEGQVWSFERHGQNFLAAHNRGIWKLPKDDSQSGHAELIFATTGVWQLDSLTSDHILVASYTGLYVIHALTGEVISSLVYDGQAIIMEAFVRKDAKLLGYHRDYGAHQVILSDDYTEIKQYSQQIAAEGDPEGINQALDHADLRLELPSATYVWATDKIHKITLSSQHGGRGIQKSEHHYLFPLDGGYMIQDERSTEDTTCLDRISIDKLMVRDSTISYDSEIIELPASDPRLIVRLRSESFLDDCVTEYKLSSWADLWRPMPMDGQMILNQMRAGSHVLLLRDREGRERHLMELEVNPRWYASGWAVIGYTLIGVVLLWLVSRLYSYRLSREKRRLYIESQRAIKEEKLKGKNKQLRQELRQKRKMLANSALILAQRNEMLTKLKTTISKAVRNGDDVPELKQKLVSRIDKHLRSESHWEIFEKNFAEIHEDFLDTLKARYPTITSGELRLAAYIRMNLSSKEIAPLLNISVRSVENKRHRLRKKMGLSPKISLSDHIMRS